MGDADTDFIFCEGAFPPTARVLSHHHFYHGHISLSTQSAPLILPLSSPSQIAVSHILKSFRLFFCYTSGKKTDLLLFSLSLLL